MKELIIKISEEEKNIISKNKIFFDGLKQVQDLYFETLCERLKLNDLGEDWLFEYIYNFEKQDVSFDEFLLEKNVNQEDIFE